MEKAKPPRVTNATREDLEVVAKAIEDRMHISFDICLERILHIEHKCDGKEVFNAYTLAGKKSHSEITEELAVVLAQGFAYARMFPMYFDVDELEEILANHECKSLYKWDLKARNEDTQHE